MENVSILEPFLGFGKLGAEKIFTYVIMCEIESWFE